MSVEDSTLAAFQHVAQTLQWVKQHPYGPEASPETRHHAGDACVRLCGEDPDKARTLWKLIVGQCGGYMPEAAAVALVRAGATANLVPDITPVGDLAESER